VTDLRALCRLLACALALAFAAPAYADVAPPPLAEGLAGDARAAYERGRTQYAAGDYVGARNAFGSAFEQSHDPRLLWNMAACERKLGRAAKALTLIDRYVALGGALLADADRQEAARWRGVLEKGVATVTVTGALAGVEVLVDDEQVGTTPLAVPVFVDAGAHRVRFTRRGFRSVARLEQVAAGATLAWSADLERIKVRLVGDKLSERPGASP
jgi:tetratricopeptide (TPR) repeat protein